MQQHTESTKLSVPGWERTYNALVRKLLIQFINPLCQGLNGLVNLKGWIYCHH